MSALMPSPGVAERAAAAVAARATGSGPPEYHDPVWLVRRAWSSYRLPGLQAVIRATIGQLQEHPLADVSYRAVPGSVVPTRLPDPVLEALHACSEELRDASGMAGSQVARAAHCSLVRRYIAQQPPAWGATFTAALESYRRAACTALLAVFAKPTTPT